MATNSSVMFYRRPPRLPWILSVAICVVAVAWIYDALALGYMTSGIVRRIGFAPLEPVTLALMEAPAPVKIEYHVPPAPASGASASGDEGMAGIRAVGTTPKKSKRAREMEMGLLAVLSAKDGDQLSAIFGSADLENGVEGGVVGGLVGSDPSKGGPTGATYGVGGFGLRGVGAGGTGEGTGGFGGIGHGSGGGGALAELGSGSGSGRGRLGTAVHDEWPQKVQAAIAAHWTASDSDEGDSAVRVLLVLNEHGRIVRTRILSGSGAARAAALAAITSAEPFPAPPESHLHNGEASIVVRLER